jgi:hypothetical protein
MKDRKGESLPDFRPLYRDRKSTRAGYGWNDRKPKAENGPMADETLSPFSQEIIFMLIHG